MSSRKEKYRNHRSLYFNDVKCRLTFSRYYDGRLKLILKELNTDTTITIATINRAQDGIMHSSINNDIVVKSWGVNDGIYEMLKDNNIISKAFERVPVGYNEAHVCKLLINPEEYENE